MMNIKSNLGKKIKELRLKHGMTQEQLGEKIGLQSQTVSQLEHGETFLSCDVLEKLCLTFNVSPKLFFDFQKDENPSKDLMNDIIDRLKHNPERLSDVHKIVRALTN